MSNDLALAHSDAGPDDHLLPSSRRPPTQALARPSASAVALDAARLQPNEAAGYLMLASDKWQLLQAQCTELVKGGALHSSINTPAKAAMIGLKAIEMGIPLTAAFSGMRFIDGELALLGKLVLRLIHQRAVPGGAVCRPIRVPPEEQHLKAGWLMGRAGEDPEEYWFTMEMAKRADLLRIYSRKTNNGAGGWIDAPVWKRYPQRMLRWRALAEGASYVFQDICQGCLIAEELSHKDPEFLEAQATEAERGSAPTFSQGAPVRQELSKGDDRLAELSDLMSEYATKRSQLAGLQGDTLDDGWYDRVYDAKRSDLCDRCVRGRFPTAGEANTMKQILHDELRVLNEQLTNATVPVPPPPIDSTADDAGDEQPAPDDGGDRCEPAGEDAT